MPLTHGALLMLSSESECECAPDETRESPQFRSDYVAKENETSQRYSEQGIHNHGRHAWRSAAPRPNTHQHSAGHITKVADQEHEWDVQVACSRQA